MASREQLLKTATAYVNAHSSLDNPAIMALCAPNCRHRGGPASLKTPDRNNAEYEAFHGQVFPIFHSYEAKLWDAVVDVSTRRVITYIKARATADAGVYESEYVITLTMTEDGTKVEDQYDFIDSHVMMEWMKKVTPSQ